MRVKVEVIEVDGTFRLQTTRGMAIGQRLYSVAPKKGMTLPEVPERAFSTRFEAERAKLDWNTYLLHAWKTRSKEKTRVSE